MDSPNVKPDSQQRQNPPCLDPPALNPAQGKSDVTKLPTGQPVLQEASPASVQCLRSLLDFCCFCGKTHAKGVVSDADTENHWICCNCTQKHSPKPLNCKLQHCLPNIHKSDEPVEKVVSQKDKMVETGQYSVVAKGESSVENTSEGAIFDLPTMVFQKVKEHMSQAQAVWDPMVGRQCLQMLENKGFT